MKEEQIDEPGANPPRIMIVDNDVRFLDALRLVLRTRAIPHLTPKHKLKSACLACELAMV